MLPMKWQQIDKFYWTYFGIMAILSVVVIFTFKTIFSSMITAFEIDNYDLTSELRVDKESLNASYDFVYNNEHQVLEVRE